MKGSRSSRLFYSSRAHAKFVRGLRSNEARARMIFINQRRLKNA